MKPAYVCTNFNNSHFTVDAVRSLMASAGGTHTLHVAVVDNQSTRPQVETLLALAAEFPGVVDLLLNEHNVGYFPGLNCGIRRLRERCPEVQYLVIGNNDLLFPFDFCDAVQRQLSLFEQHAVVSPDIITLDGKHQNPHVINTISRKRELVYDLYYANYQLALAIRWAAGLMRSFTDRSDKRDFVICCAGKTAPNRSPFSAPCWKCTPCLPPTSGTGSPRQKPKAEPKGKQKVKSPLPLNSIMSKKLD